MPVHPVVLAYAREALVVHGSGRGTWLTLRRLLPLPAARPSGFDPVPETKDR